MQKDDILNSKNLLVLTSIFPDKSESYYDGIFIKSQVEELGKYFENIVVISPTPYTFGLTKEDKLCHDYEFGNIKVYFPRYLHFPINYFRKNLGNNHFKAINTVIKKNNIKFDLIHSHFTWPSGYAGNLLKKEYDKPMIVTVHEDHDWLMKEIKSGKKELVDTWKSSESIIRVNKKDVNILNQFNNRVFHITEGYDKRIFKKLNKLECRKLYKLPLKKKIILNVGYLVEQKNQEVLIKAIAELINKRKDIFTLIVGDGPLKPQLEKLIEKLNLNQYVKVMSGKPPNEIPSLMSAADIFVLPSLSESFGIVQIEAMACGVPVIATLNGGSEEIITSENFGFLVSNPNDYKYIAEKINEAIWKDWNEKMIIEHANVFSWEKIVVKICKLYREALNKV
jgi:teichuronic acid biosynthesis glycosyltransferase TuaC